MNITPASVEQMEAVTAARRIGRRAALLETAKRGQSTNPYYFVFVIIGLLVYAYIGKPSDQSLAIAAIGLNFAVFFWNFRLVATRLDAIAELLAAEESKPRE